ncbi:SPOR domain-containing protein [Bacteroides mediterraneensis]|uniref:HU-CCDC81 and SPOR domain-containing protein n=1 Tax=Bacteroides mediterraneensis TaxID=1841856 RepID=A0ABS2EYE7_9BACE|nr:SPOR domain-containing protein [Bacteroides mediterraneensis]MBM6759568.1 HU-CCDC81 and SPOR domain-containing protein [Bacteroides mediterraneensis]
MIELAKHIEVLLLENDCVIVPGLGGFIAHRQQAVISPTGEFQPPRRTIGFNPQLVMNDGLLVQSYMQAYNTDFPDATRRIEKVVTEMKDQMYQQGQVTLPHVGTIYYNMNGGYTFEPASPSFFTPGLYGLETFTLPALKALPATEPKEYKLPEINRPANEKKRHFSLRHFTRNVVAIAAAVCLFFVLSVPVENTYMDDANYASLGSFSMFDAIRNQSVATSIQTTSQTAPQKKAQKQKKAQRVRNNVNTLKPVVVKTEKIAAAPAAQKETQPAVKKTAPAQPAATPAPAIATGKKKAYIIVASLTTHNDAQQEVKRLQKKGYPNCKILETDGRFRVALDGYANSGEAYKKVQELRNQEEFKSAWVFTSK